MAPELQYIIAYQCGNLNCGVLMSNENVTCASCGSQEVKPLYDYYRILKLSPTSLSVELKELNSAYRKASLKYHPDINTSGREMFLLVSEAFKTLKDINEKQKYDIVYHQIQQGNFATYQQMGPSRQSESAYWQSNNPYDRYKNEFDFETIFRNFHGFNKRNNINIKRASNITAMLGSIIGIVIGTLTGGLLIIPGAIFGFILGKFNPQMGILLIRITNFFVLLLSFTSSAFLLVIGKLPLIFIVLVLTFIYLNKSKKWESEFKDL